MPNPLISIINFLPSVALTLGLGAATVLNGCSFAQLHGYAVVRTSADVGYDAGPFLMLPLVGGETTFVAELENGMREGLRARAPEFVPTNERGSAFTVRVRLDEPIVADGRTNVHARIEILDRDGTVTSELTTEHAVEAAMDATAMTHIGRTFGERLGHYLRERERYYHY